MTAHYLNARVLFVVVGATLLVLVSFAFTRASSPPLPFHFGTSNVTESPSDGLLEHAGNETLGVSIAGLCMKEAASSPD